MKQLITSLLFAGPVMLAAQNLVENPGFETFRAPVFFQDVTNSFGSMKVDGWYLPTTGTADYLQYGNDRTQSKNFIKVIAGDHAAHEGSGYAGFYGNFDGYTEYLGGTLTEKLVAGKRYVVSFYLLLGADCAQGLNGVGMLFSGKQLSTNYEVNRLKDSAQVKFPGSGGANVSGNWVEFRSVFTATGTESFFVIGNFNKGPKEGVRQFPGKKGHPWSYYLVDDICIAPFDGKASPVVSIDAIAPGKSFTARNIYFDTDKATIKPESYPVLFTLLAAIKKQPGIKVEVHGFTDTTGSAAHNQKLSEARAKAIADFFISNGVPAADVSWKGLGEAKPESATDNARNRRVEFVFL